MMLKLKKERLRNRSLHKPTIVPKECSSCTEKYFQRKNLYNKLKKNLSKYNQQKEKIQEFKLTDLQAKTLILEKWSKKMLSLAHTIFESNLMSLYYSSHNESYFEKFS